MMRLTAADATPAATATVPPTPFPLESAEDGCVNGDVDVAGTETKIVEMKIPDPFVATASRKPESNVGLDAKLTAKAPRAKVWRRSTRVGPVAETEAGGWAAPMTDMVPEFTAVGPRLGAACPPVPVGSRVKIRVLLLAGYGCDTTGGGINSMRHSTLDKAGFAEGGKAAFMKPWPVKPPR